LVDLREDPDNAGKYLLPLTLNIPSWCKTVFRRTVDGKEKTDVVNIGYMIGETPDGHAELGYDLEFGLSSPSGPGRITLSPNSAEDYEKWKYLEHSIYNESSPRRAADTRIPAIYKKIDVEKVAKDKRALRLLKKQAIDLAVELSDTDAIALAGLFTVTKVNSADVARDIIESKAEVSPEEFIKVHNSKISLYDSYIKKSKELKVIKMVPKSTLFEWEETGEMIMSYKGPKTAYKEFSDFLEANPEVFNKLKTLTDAKS
jgi:hypothetical protein